MRQIFAILIFSLSLSAQADNMDDMVRSLTEKAKGAIAQTHPIDYREFSEKIKSLGASARNVSYQPAPRQQLKGHGSPDNCPEFYRFGPPKFSEAKVERRVFYLCRIGYAAAFDPATKTPLWSAEHLTSASVHGREPRSNNFQPDPDLPYGASSQLADYSHSGYDRGHMSPAGDMRTDPNAMSESFYLSNMVPQAPDNNQNIWKNIETLTRNEAQHRGELFVVTGPIYDGHFDTIGRDHVAVPTHLYKIILDAKTGANLAFIVPNVNGLDQYSYGRYVVSIREVEKRTGINFHSTLPQATQDKIETATNGFGVH